jgi:hypothetical protein
MIVVLCAASPVTTLAADWPTAPKPAAPAKPAAPKPVAKVASVKAEPVPAKATSPVSVKKDDAVALKMGASAPAAAAVVAPRTDSSSELKMLTELVARQSAAIEALTKRLDAAAAAPMTAAPKAASIVAPATPAVGSPATTTVVLPAPVAAPAAAAPVAAAQTTAPRPAAPAAVRPLGYKRWADVQQFALGLRYRYIDNSAGVRTNDQGQNSTAVKARFKFDRAGHYAVNAGVFSGASNTSLWNNTGMGTGDPARDLHLKQLYFAAAPIAGLELQYGGLYIVRGEGTEITTYDNDGYVTGQRVTVKRPKQLWFDEISATQAYLGDAKVPDMWNRYHRLTESNYYQILFGKKVGKHVGVSADYTEALGVPTWRSAVAFKAPMVVLDGLRYEAYARSEVGPTPFGWALTLDKKVGRAAMSGGYISIDEHYGGLNGDYFGKGNRWFGKASATLFPMLTVTTQYTYALEADYAIANQERFDLVFTYDVLKTFAQAPRR